jgi:hypothetical protein
MDFGTNSSDFEKNLSNRGPCCLGFKQNIVDGGVKRQQCDLKLTDSQQNSANLGEIR